MKYNPFVYIHSEKDVLKLVNTLIANTKGEGEKSAEDFWVKSERLFYTALIGYIWYEAPAEEMNFTTLLEMINASEAREDDPDFQSPVDLMFERLEQKDPDHFAVRQYKKFLLSAGKTRSSILISCGARLAPFDIREVRELMEDDEMELDTIGDEKTVLFLIMSDTDTTFNFILAMLQSQLINLLCDRADDKYGGRLPVHVRLILDEFANIGQIPNFDKLIATIRSREISASIILQSQSQLKAIYKDAAEIISDNCDSVLFLSGRGKNYFKNSSATHPVFLLLVRGHHAQKGGQPPMKRYNTPHRSRVVKTRLTDEEYADFTARLAPYGMSQSEFIRQAITRATIRSFPNCKQNCPTSGSITLTGYPAISLPLGGNTRTMQPLSADGWLTMKK